MLTDFAKDMNCSLKLLNYYIIIILPCKETYRFLHLFILLYYKYPYICNFKSIVKIWMILLLTCFDFVDFVDDRCIICDIGHRIVYFDSVFNCRICVSIDFIA